MSGTSEVISMWPYILSCWLAFLLIAAAEATHRRRRSADPGAPRPYDHLEIVDADRKTKS